MAVFLNKMDGMRNWCFRIMLVMTGLLLAGQVMAQGVRWEDYRGSERVADDADYTGPAGAPKFTNFPNDGAIANLRAVAVNPANAVRTGTSATIDFASGATDALCDNRNDTTSVPCRLQAQGKIAYALIQFPQAGTYTIAAAHDDNLVIELSPDYTNTNYHAASYSILAGTVGAWTADESTYETFGSFTAPNPNSCALVRMLWTNQEGLNFDHLRWTTPGGTTQIIPASALKDPAAAASSASCNGSITTNTIQLNKVIGSPRRNGNDQFTVEIGTTKTGGTVSTATTTGTGTGQQASANLNPANLGTTYYLREVMAGGSSSSLGNYTATIACTRNGVAYTPTVVSAANRRWSISTALGGDSSVNFICTITNTAPAVKPTVTINKVSVGGTGTFAFTGNNGIPNPYSITTAGDSVSTAGPTYPLTTASTSTTITESTPPVGWTLQGISCSGLGSGGTATPNLATRTVTLNAAATANGSAIVCTFTNTNQVGLSITKKTNTSPVVSGQPVSYTITVANAGPATATGAVVKDTPVSGLACPPANTVTCSGAGCPGGAITVGNLLSGITMGTMAAGTSATLTFTCTAN